MAYTSIISTWTGAAGLPGYTKFRFDGALDPAAASSAAARVVLFWNNVRLFIPSSITIYVSGSAQIYDGALGLAGEVSFATPAPIQGMGGGSYAGGSGAVILWRTGLILNGRRVKGRTFLVPLVGAFQTDGSLDPAARNTLANAAATLSSTAPDLLIVSASGPIGAVSTSSVTGSSVPDRAAQLRSRR